MHINMCGRLHRQAQAEKKEGSKGKKWGRNQSILSFTVSSSLEWVTLCFCLAIKDSGPVLDIFFMGVQSKYRKIHVCVKWNNFEYQNYEISSAGFFVLQFCDLYGGV